MNTAKGLQRLLRVRRVEEEQRRGSLESWVTRLRSLEQAREALLAVEKQGTARQTAGMIGGSIADRQAGLVEAECARRHARVLSASIAACRDEVAARRQEYLQKRLERRQAEVIVEEAAAADELKSSRHSQQQADDWYGERSHRKSAGGNG